MSAKRYVALGSSMAAGPGIWPPAAGSPIGAGRSARNYPHLVAHRHHLDLVDVTFSGATTAHVLGERQRGVPPQIEALDGSEALVTVTIGGNDVGYVPLLMGAALLGNPVTRLLPWRHLWTPVVRSLPLPGGRISELLDRGARVRALAQVADSLGALGRALRHRAPDARILFVDYLTVLPPAGMPAAPLSESDADLGRYVADRLEELTATAAQATGCDIVRVGAASREHHAWSADPWTVGAMWPLPWAPAPMHPNLAGMRAVAELISAWL